MLIPSCVKACEQPVECWTLCLRAISWTGHWAHSNSITLKLEKLAVLVKPVSGREPTFSRPSQASANRCSVYKKMMLMWVTHSNGQIVSSPSIFRIVMRLDTLLTHYVSGKVLLPSQIFVALRGSAPTFTHHCKLTYRCEDCLEFQARLWSLARQLKFLWMIFSWQV